MKVQAEHRDGMCVLRVAGEIDIATAGTFTASADAALRGTQGPVAVDLTGLGFVDAAGARALTQLLRRLSAGRLADVTSCDPAVRRAMQVMCLPSPDYWIARRTTRQYGTRELTRLVHGAVLDATGILTLLNDTRIRVASTRERADLTRQQAQQALTRARAARQHLARSRQQPASPGSGH